MSDVVITGIPPVQSLLIEFNDGLDMTAVQVRAIGYALVAAADVSERHGLDLTIAWSRDGNLVGISAGGSWTYDFRSQGWRLDA